MAAKEQERKQNAQAKKTTLANLPKSPTKPAHDSRAVAAAAVGLKPRTADKLEKLVDAKDAGNPAAAAALAKIDEKKGRGVDSAFRAVVQPGLAKNAEQVQAHKNAAHELQALLNASGINADVASSRAEGKFHVTLHDVTAEQVQEFAKAFTIEPVTA